MTSAVRLGLIVAALAAAAPAAATPPTMSVSAFLAKADALQAKGALAMFSSDLKLLTRQVKGDAGTLRAERLAAKSVGKPTAFCPPAEGAKLSDKDILAAMQAVAPVERPSTSTRDALKTFLARRYPCA